MSHEHAAFGLLNISPQEQNQPKKKNIRRGAHAPAAPRLGCRNRDLVGVFYRKAFCMDDMAVDEENNREAR